MKLKNLLWVFEILAIAFWAVFFVILFFTNPNKSDISIFILFFITLFFAFAFSWGLAELYFVTKIRGMEEIKGRSFSAFRHGFMVSMVLSGILFMQGAGVLTLWDGIIFVLAIVLFEAYFLTRNNIVTDTEK